MAKALKTHAHEILVANAIDIENAEKSDISSALCDRLKLNPTRNDITIG